MYSPQSDEIARILEKKAVPERAAAHAAFIKTRLETSKSFDKYGLEFRESNATIIKSIMGELRNTVLGFFKGKTSGFHEKRCDACDTTAKDVQYERAHDRSMCREAVALDALKLIRPDESVPIKQKDFIKAFVMQHAKYPLWYLCKPCHKKYDSKVKGTASSHTVCEPEPDSPTQD